MEIIIFYMHDFDMILLLKIRWKVWVWRIRTVYSTARLHIYERRQIRKIFGGGGNWTQCPMAIQKDIQSWPSKTNNLHLCRELNPEPRAPKSVTVRCELSSLDFSGQQKIASCFSCFSWSIQRRLQTITCKICPLTFNLLKPSIIFLAIHDHDQW